MPKRTMPEPSPAMPFAQLTIRDTPEGQIAWELGLCPEPKPGGDVVPSHKIAMQLLRVLEIALEHHRPKVVVPS